MPAAGGHPQPTATGDGTASSEAVFDDRLSRSGPGATRPLPDRFQSLAAAIVGRAGRPRIATGAASADALRTTGARAATTGRTVHLPRYPTTSARALGVLGHELAHVAAGNRTSPTTGAGPRPASLFPRPAQTPAPWSAPITGTGAGTVTSGAIAGAGTVASGATGAAGTVASGATGAAGTVTSGAAGAAGTVTSGAAGAAGMVTSDGMGAAWTVTSGAISAAGTVASGATGAAGSASTNRGPGTAASVSAAGTVSGAAEPVSTAGGRDVVRPGIGAAAAGVPGRGRLSGTGDASAMPRFFGGIGSMADRGEAIASSVGADVERAASGPGGDRLLDHLAPGPARPAAGARHLPVAGPGGPAMGAVLDAARTAALQAVESAAAATGGLRGGWSPVHQADPAAGPWRDGPGSPAGHAGSRDPASDPGGSAPDPAGETVRGVLGASASAAGDSHSQLSELLEQLEERLLVEIERRGGRYAGVF